MKKNTNVSLTELITSFYYRLMLLKVTDKTNKLNDFDKSLFNLEGDWFYYHLFLNKPIFNFDNILTDTSQTKILIADLYDVFKFYLQNEVLYDDDIILIVLNIYKKLKTAFNNLALSDIFLFKEGCLKKVYQALLQNQKPTIKNDEIIFNDFSVKLDINKINLFKKLDLTNKTDLWIDLQKIFNEKLYKIHSQILSKSSLNEFLELFYHNIEEVVFKKNFNNIKK